MENKMWRCKDGRLIAISDMNDRHLDNAVMLILRSGSWRYELLERLLLEQQIRSMGLTSKRAK